MASSINNIEESKVPLSSMGIEKLPEELLEYIFKYVDQLSIASVILTCRTWKEIAERSISMKLNLHQININIEEPWVETLLASQRKYHSIKIDALAFERNRMLEIFRKHGVYIREMYLYTCVIGDLDIFLDILKALPNLKRLVISETSISYDPSNSHELPQLSKLDTLEMVKCEYRILKCFKHAQLKTLKVLCSIDRDRQLQASLIEFLQTQKKLSTMALHTINTYSEQFELFKTPLLDEEMPFQLKKLSLLGIKLRENPNDYNNLLKFMKMHARTIDELELGRKFPDFVYEFVFARFKNLKTLRLKANEIPKDQAFYDRLVVNKSVANIIIVDSPPSNQYNDGSKWLIEFLNHLPNIECLTFLESSDATLMKSVAENMKKLKCLAVHLVDGPILGELKFSALETLHIGDFSISNKWDTFTKNNPNIKDLRIEDIYDDEKFYQDIDIVAQNLKLRSIIIDCDFLEEKFFDIINKHSIDLISIDINEESVPLEIIPVNLPLRLRKDKLPKYTGFEFWRETDYNGNFSEAEDDNNWNADMIEMFGAGVLDQVDMELLMNDLDDYYDDYTDDYDSDDQFDNND